jgi:restriction endonuclease S subunit
MKLSEIAHIRIGLVLSRKKSEKNNGKNFSYKTLTLNSIETGGSVDMSRLEEYHAAMQISDKYITKEGDIIIRLSEPNTAVHINNALAGLVVPSQFDIIKVKRSDVLPEFLAWALNSTPVKRQIDQFKNGTSIKIINTWQLSEVKINVLPIKQQKQLIDINRLYRQETQLLTQLLEQQKVLYSGVMNKIYSLSGGEQR